MTVCTGVRGSSHNEICHNDNDDCPACEALKELSEAKDEINDLKYDVASLQSKLDDL